MGVAVRIDYLRRPEAIQYQNEAHRKFWERWLTERGATSVDFGVSPTRKPVPLPVAKGPTTIASKPVPIAVTRIVIFMAPLKKRRVRRSGQRCSKA